MISQKFKISLVVLALCSFSLIQAQEEKKKPNLEKAFASFDVNDDQSISLEEFKSKKRKNDIKPEVLEKRFSKIDKNDDGLVSLEEYKTAMEEGQAMKKKKQD